MISHKYKCIFIHIPKTAGTTIENLLIDRLVPIAGGSSHEKISYYKKKYPHQFNDYYKFSCVRNPWDRIVSAFFYISKGGNQSSGDKKLMEIFGNNFKNFVLKIDTLEQSLFLTPQYEFIFTNNRLLLDKVVKFESLEFDLKKVFNKLNLSVQKVYQSRQSQHRHYTDYYDEETRQIIAEKYSKDIDYFGYKFGE